jgi:dihydroorotase
MDHTGDILIDNGRIAAMDRVIAGKDAEVFDAGGRVTAPGFIDLHVHFREPGLAAAETIRTGSEAAARGGFTTVVAMPNTQPATDTAERIAWAKARGDESGKVRLLPCGTITAGRAGAQVADIAGMCSAGAVAFSDDGSTPADDDVMEQCMRAVARTGRPLMDHALDAGLSGNGVMHEGLYSRRYGLPGIPSAAEVAAVRRDIELARRTGCKIHIQHISTAESLCLIADARREGLPVTAEATPHHIALTDADVDPANADFKVNPPVRTAGDRDAIIEALRSGLITCLATDHAPHTAAAKARGFMTGPFGLVGLETAMGITYSRLVKTGLITCLDWVRLWTVGPADVVGLQRPTLAQGSIADLVIMDLESEWTVDPACFASQSQNTPFKGWRLTGRAVATLVAGRFTWRSLS